jgi:hypothetical protein
MITLKEWFRELASKAAERGSAKSRYAAAIMAATAAEKYIIIYDGYNGELEILDRSGGLLCWGFEDREAFDCVTDFPNDILEATVKIHIVSKYDDVEVVGI